MLSGYPSPSVSTFLFPSSISKIPSLSSSTSITSAMVSSSKSISQICITVSAFIQSPILFCMIKSPVISPLFNKLQSQLQSDNNGLFVTSTLPSTRINLPKPCTLFKAGLFFTINQSSKKNICPTFSRLLKPDISLIPVSEILNPAPTSSKLSKLGIISTVLFLISTELVIFFNLVKPVKLLIDSTFKSFPISSKLLNPSTCIKVGLEVKFKSLEIVTKLLNEGISVKTRLLLIFN